jgi:pimeloyl-ACP methyl ester carboxylesterase
VYAKYLRQPGHLKATLEWFRAWPHDMLDIAPFKDNKLTMPVLAIGADGSMGGFVTANAKDYAEDVTGIILADSGHWIYEEHPEQLTEILLAFL